MPSPRFTIGIDLGTTNSALAFSPLDGDAPPDILRVPQWESLTALVESPTLPSFLYLPEDAVAARLRGGKTGGGNWIVGRLARARAGEVPGRVVHSAKSWLCHHAANRLAPFLPWNSTDLAADEKISPVRAGALVLNYLRGVWNDRFAAAGGDPFDDQIITITVPASFDAAAQRLTLAAAAEAGFPDGVRLLEEPQAAFTCWLQGNSTKTLWPDDSSGPRHVLVVDIGGGTSDFSLFALHPNPRSALPDVRRVAVSDHILLGGDNVDRALAFLVEQRLGTGRGALAGPQWDFLVAACRDLKESALSATGAPEESFVVAVAGRGSVLVAGSRSVTLTRAEIETLLLDGFFPDCDAAARPYRAQGGLRELGLPYATDSAVTHHLAEFLREQPRVDAVLFNGGSMHPARLRARVRDQIGAWQGGAAPIVLENDEPDLAVARGAARYGALLHRHAPHIAAGAARAIFLEVARPGTDPSVVCVLPRGAGPEELFEITDPALAVMTDRPVRFRAFSSTRHGTAKAGDILPLREDRFSPLPPLQTMMQTDAPAEGKTVPVRLTARMNALGLLQIACVSADPAAAKTWPLEFNLRAQDSRADQAAAESAPPLEPNAKPADLAAAQQRLAAVFGQRPGKTAEKIAASTLLKSLESRLGSPRAGWNAALLRALWPALADHFDGRGFSVDHEDSWLTLAGFLLRPGFGVAGDAARIDSLWRVHDQGPRFPGRRIKTQEYILWRRVAAGLTPARQEILIDRELERLRAGTASPELVRLAGSLELITRDLKNELAGRFLETAVTLARAKKHCAPYLAALGLLLNRAPFHAGPETVLPPACVEAAYDALRGFDWADADLLEIQTLFLRAARVVDDRGLDVPKPLRLLIAGKLEKAGVPATKTARIKDFVPIGRADRASLVDEALPPGLILGA